MWTRTLALVNQAARIAARRDLPDPTSVEVNYHRRRADNTKAQPLLTMTFATLDHLLAWASDLGVPVLSEPTIREGHRHLVLFGFDVQDFPTATVQLSSFETAGTWTWTP